MADPTEDHHLRVAPSGDTTHASCTCGQWERDAGAETLAVTGKSREEALRAAHDLHARGISSA